MIFRTRNIVTYYWLIIVTAFSSCVTIKDYPAGKPFFYANTIKVNGNLSGNDKAMLKEKLLAQIEDTAQPVIKTGFYFFKKGHPVTTRYITEVFRYDSNAVVASAQNMNNLLMTQGYFRGRVLGANPTIFKASKDSQMIKAYVNYTANLGKEFRFNELVYSFKDSVLSSLIAQNRAGSFIRKKDVFTKAAMNNESDRLVNIFRNNGYFKINREAMYSLIDTFPAELLDPSLSEIELIRLQIESQKRRENPMVDVEIRQSEDFDSSRLKQYYVKNIMVYPDNRPDSVYINEHITTRYYEGLTILYHDPIIHASVLRRMIFDTIQGLYNQSTFNQSISNLNRLGVWQSISADIAENNDTVINGKVYGQLTLIYRLMPATKYAYTFNVGISKNTNNNSTVINQGSFFGLSAEGSRNNRNFLKEGIQSNTSLRAGVEFYRIDTIQTFEGSVSQSFSIPKFVIPFFRIRQEKYLNQRTFFNLSGTYTNRRDFFELYQANINWGYEWRTKHHKNLSWIYRPFNLEYLYYPTSKKLQDLIDSNQFLKYTFNSGLILGQTLTSFITLPSPSVNIRNSLRVNVEESGYFGLMGAIFNSKRILPYWKLDAEYKHYKAFPKSSFIFRAYGGVGSAYGNDTNSNVIMPLPKRFVAGGPNSMRAWRLRKLGLGSMSRAESTTDRLGDVQIELNAEYRFNLFPVFGFMLEGAVFTDAGNVWVKSRRSAPDNDARAVFSLSELYPSMAMDAGAGLRLNFGQFQIRLDWAYTLKDPQFATQHAGWFPTANKFGQRQALQFNVNYPF
jgi:hypothetical protein